ncbi:SpaA isopeptide-forming pilin-related protein [Amedibacillus sp. YH-ame6]
MIQKKLIVTYEPTVLFFNFPELFEIYTFIVIEGEGDLMLKKIKLFVMVIFILISNIFIDFKMNTTKIEALNEGSQYAGAYSTFNNYIRKWDYINANKLKKPARKYSVVSASDFNNVIESIAYCADANTEFAVKNPLLIASKTPPGGKYGIKNVWNKNQAKRDVTQAESDMINLIVNYGYGFVDNRRGVNFKDEIYRVATQNLIWRYLLRKDYSSAAGNAYYGDKGWSKDSNTASDFGIIPSPGNGIYQSTLKDCEKEIMNIVNEQLDSDIQLSLSGVTSDYIKYNENQHNLILVESRTAVLHDEKNLLSATNWYIDNIDELENKGLVVSIDSENNLRVKLKEGYGSKLGANTKIILSNVREKDKASSNSKESMWLKSTSSQTLVVKQGIMDRNVERLEISVEAGSGILLKKIDENGNPLANAVFSYGVNLSGEQGSITGFYNKRTAADGIIKDTRVWPSNSIIKIKEIAAPEGYEISSTIQQQKLEPGKILTFNNVKNIREPRSFKIIKKDDQNPGKRLSGVTFKYGTNLNGKENVDWFMKTTDANGEINVTTRLWYAGTKVYIKEINSLTGYVMDTSQKELVISKNDALNVVEFINQRETYPILIKKQDAYTKNPLENATFWVSEYSDFSSYDVYKTNVNGVILTKKYPINTTVYYKEVLAPDGYSGDSSVKTKKVVVPSDIAKNVENTVTVFNSLKPFKIKLFKRDNERIPISNAAFEIYQQNTDTNPGVWTKLDEKLITNSEGIAISKNAYPMTSNYKYQLKEVVVPIGYKAISDYIQVTVSNKTLNLKELSLNVEVENEKVPTSFSIYKFNSENKNKALKGAKFSIIRIYDNMKVAELETDANGNASTSALLADVDYRIEEIQAPKGYKITFKPEVFKLSSSNSYKKHFEISNNPYQANIEVYKTDENRNPLNNVEFYIYQNNTIIDRLVTSDVGTKKGYAKSKNLDFDVDYTIREVSVPPGYVRNFSQNFRFNFSSWEPKDEVLTYNVVNTKQKGSIKVTKYADNGITKIGNVKFSVYNRITGALLGTMITDANGVATLANLPVIDGKSNGYYRIIEDSTPLPYYVPANKNMLDFEIDATTDGTQPLLKEFTFRNPEIRGNIALTKRDVDTNKPLSNVKFQLYKDNGNLSPTPIGSVQTTDSNGNVSFNNLPYGNYLIKESQRLSNYFKDDPKCPFYDKTTGYYRVTVNENGETLQVNAYNKKRTFKVSVNKLDSSTKNPVGGAEFQIIDTTDGNKVLDTMISDPITGKAQSKTIEMPASNHTVIVKETKAPVGYTLTENQKTLAFDNYGDDANYVQQFNFTWENNRNPASVELLKVDQYGNPIEGVQFSFKQGGFTFYENTNKSGIIDVTRIINYYGLSSDVEIEEVVPPDTSNYVGLQEKLYLYKSYGRWDLYSCDNNFVSREIDYVQNSTKIKIINYLKEANLTIKKVDNDNTNKFLVGAEYEIIPLNGIPVTLITTGSTLGDTVKLPYAPSYTVQEKKSPAGYELDSNIYTYRIEDFSNVNTPNRGITIGYKKDVTFKNKQQKYGQIHLEKMLRPAGVNISGVSFDLYSIENGKLTFIDSIMTGYFGDVTYPRDASSGYSDGLGKGDYFLVEKDTTDRGFTYDISEVTKVDGKTGVKFSITEEDIKNAVNTSSTIFKELLITNWEMKGNIRVRKVNSAGDSISGAVFDVYKTQTNGDTKISTITTDSNGYANVRDVDPGTYKVVEKSVPPPYKVDSTPQVKKVEVASVASAVTPVYTDFVFTNQELKGNVTIQKIDAKTKKPVAGVEFTLYEWISDSIPTYDGFVGERVSSMWKYRTVSTDANGKVTIANIPYKYLNGKDGYYFIYETWVPAGYEKNKKGSVLQIKEGNENFNFTYENEQSKGNVKLKKVDEKGSPLGGAKFRITGISVLGENIDYVSYTDPIDGIISVDLPYGNYSIKEEAPPAGYIQKDFSSKAFTLSYSSPTFIDKFTSPYVNTKTKYAVQVIKEDKANRQRLKGAVFEAYEKDKNSSNGEALAQCTTNNSGFCILNLESAGEYDIYEKTAPEGYKKIDGLIQRVQISDETPTVTLDAIKNEPSPILLRLYKYDYDEGLQGLLSGAVFYVYDSKTNDFVMALPPTNYEGVTSANLPYGEYYVKEVTPPEGYEQNTEKFNITYWKETDDTGNIKYIGEEWIANKKITTSSIKIKKYDKEDPTKLLENAVFQILNDKGEVVEDNLITGPDGTVSSKSLAYGSYVVKEITPPSHYETDKDTNGDEKTYPVEVASTSEKVILVSVANTPKKQDIEIIKFDSNDESILLDGAQFEIFYDNECKNQVTGTTIVETIMGKAKFDGLPLGVYYIKEIKAPDGYQDDKKIFWIDTRYQSEVIRVSNTKVPSTKADGQLKIEKVEKDDTTKKLNGAQFHIVGPNGYDETVLCDGELLISNLAYGSYTITEVLAPTGYQKSDEEKVIEVTKDSSIEPVLVSFVNDRIYGSLHITKIDSITKEPLSNAIFEIYEYKDGVRGMLMDTIMTDLMGQATSTMLPFGQYEVVETKAPEGYLLAGNLTIQSKQMDNVQANSKVVSIVSSNTVVQVESFENLPVRGSVKILKQDENNLPIADVVFQLYDAEGNFIEGKQIITDEQGSGVIENLPYGTYYFEEVSAPEQYYLNENFFPFKIENNQEVVILPTIVNESVKGKISIKKIDFDTSLSLGNASYGIYEKIDDNGMVIGDPIDTVTTKAEEFVSTNIELSPGTYYIKEIQAPNHYRLNEEITKLELTRDTPSQSVILSNEHKKASIKIRKVDKDNPNMGLKGAIFELYDAANYDQYIQSSDETIELKSIGDPIVTDENGEGTSSNALLTNGNYVLLEKRAPDGYALTNEPIRFSIDDSQDNTVIELPVIKNEAFKGLIIYKHDQSGGPLPFAHFKVYKMSGDVPSVDDTFVGEYDSDAYGLIQIDISSIGYGRYYANETRTPSDEYALPSDVFFFNELTKDNPTAKLSVENKFIASRIEVIKKDVDTEENLGKGFKFNIYTKHGYENAVENNTLSDLDPIEMIETDERGIAISQSELMIGDYVVMEVEASQGYELSKEVQHISVDNTSSKNITLVFKNEMIKGRIRIQKSVDGDLPGQRLSLENAKFNIVDELGNVVDTLITDINGRAESKELLYGSYSVVEIAAPIGSIIPDIAIKTIAIDGSQSSNGKIYICNFENPAITSKIQIVKQDASNHDLKLANAEFSILDQNKNVVLSSLVTDSMGEITSGDLPYGRYYIREVKAPDGYLPTNEDIAIDIKKNKEVIKIVVDNYPARNEVKLFKYDSDSKKGLENVVFQLYKKDLNGDYQLFEDDLKTSGEGIILKDYLEVGDYYFIEKEALEDYVNDKKEHYFHVGDGSITDPIKMIPINISNEKAKANVTFEKIGDVLSGVEDKGEIYPGLKEYSYTKGKVDDVTIGIYATEAIDLNGKHFETDELIQLLYSNKEGISLPKGKYKYKELQAPNGYLLDEKEYEFIIGNQEIASKKFVIEMTDIHVTMTINIKKVLENLEQGKETYYDDVLFGIYTKKEIKEIPPDTLVKLLKFDRNGDASWSGLLPEGEYYIKELTTHPEYVLSDTKYPLVIDYLSNPNQNQNISINDGNEIINKIQTDLNKFEFYKIDQDVHDMFLKGATFDLYYCTKQHTHHAFVDTDCWTRYKSAVSDEDGRVSFGDIPYGVYQLVESKAPDGYETPSGQWTLTIDKDEIVFKANGVVPAFLSTDNKYMVTNSLKKDLPLSGGTGNVMYYFAGTTLVGVGWIISKKNKKRRKEET